jgi:hypothetical protein
MARASHIERPEDGLRGTGRGLAFVAQSRDGKDHRRDLVSSLLGRADDFLRLNMLLREPPQDGVGLTVHLANDLRGRLHLVDQRRALPRP